MMWIDDNAALDALIDEVIVSERYALDTEFHREKTYYPKLALLQIRVGETTALVDPLAVDTTLLVRLFAEHQHLLGIVIQFQAVMILIMD